MNDKIKIFFMFKLDSWKLQIYNLVRCASKIAMVFYHYRYRLSYFFFNNRPLS